MMLGTHIRLNRRTGCLGSASLMLGGSRTGIFYTIPRIRTEMIHPAKALAIPPLGKHMICSIESSSSTGLGSEVSAFSLLRKGIRIYIQW